MITETVEALAAPHIGNKFILFPTDSEQINMNKKQFQAIANFPRVVGVIDGTHIRIIALVSMNTNMLNERTTTV